MSLYVHGTYGLVPFLPMCMSGDIDYHLWLDPNTLSVLISVLLAGLCSSLVLTSFQVETSLKKMGSLTSLGLVSRCVQSYSI